MIIRHCDGYRGRIRPDAFVKLPTDGRQQIFNALVVACDRRAGAVHLQHARQNG
jgi:hypothetical protein